MGTENIVFGRREKQGRKGKKIFGERKNVWEEKEKEENIWRSQKFFEEKEKEENVW